MRHKDTIAKPDDVPLPLKDTATERSGKTAEIEPKPAAKPAPVKKLTLKRNHSADQRANLSTHTRRLFAHPRRPAMPPHRPFLLPKLGPCDLTPPLSSQRGDIEFPSSSPTPCLVLKRTPVACTTPGCVSLCMHPAFDLVHGRSGSFRRQKAPRCIAPERP